MIGRRRVNEKIEELIRRIKKKVRVKRTRRWKEGRRGWWDGECKRKKRKVENRLKERGVAKITGGRRGKTERYVRGRERRRMIDGWRRQGRREHRDRCRS